MAETTTRDELKLINTTSKTPDSAAPACGSPGVSEQTVMRRLSAGRSKATANNGRRSLFTTPSPAAPPTIKSSPKSVFSMPASPVHAAAALSAQGGAPKQEDKGSSIAIEGNIGVGKSTFLRLMNKVKGLEGNIVTMPEPVDKWQNVGGNADYNLLQYFYEKPHRYSYTFQSYAFITRFMQHNEGVKNNPNKVSRARATPPTSSGDHGARLPPKRLLSPLSSVLALCCLVLCIRRY